MTRFALSVIVALTFGSFACGLKVKNDNIMLHSDVEGSEDDIAPETREIFANFDKNGDKKLDLAEYNTFRKKEGDEEETTAWEFRELALKADPDNEHPHGPLALTIDDYQMLVNTDTLIGSRIIPSQESIQNDRKEWLNARQWRHNGFSDQIKNAIVENGDAMVQEIFDAHDTDKDGVLHLSEFNKLQEVTEGTAGIYNAEQFADFLSQADPNGEQDALSFDILKSMYLDSDYSAEFQTELPGDYERLLKAGVIAGTATKEGDVKQ